MVITTILIITGAAVVGGTVGAIIGFGVENVFKKLKKNEIGMAVLGTNDSGKTTWYNYLKGTPEQARRIKSQTIAVDNTPKFEIKFDSGKRIYIKEGKDINGTSDRIKNHYEPMIKENDVILFMVDLSLFLKEEKMKLDVCDRLFVINTLLKRCQERDNAVKLLYLVFTHADKVKDLNNSTKQAIAYLQRKNFDVTKYCCVNLLKDEDCNKLKKRLFGREKESKNE